MRCDFLIVGATGMQGRIASRDLLERGYSVAMSGRDKQRVRYLLKQYPRTSSFHHVELSDEDAVSKLFDSVKARVVINCAEGDWNYIVLRQCVRAGVSSVDLGSEMDMTEMQLALHPTLQKKKIVHVTGCGSVPGIGNVMLNHAAQKFDSIEHVDAGFVWSSNIPIFVVPFSIESILEEFTNPAPVVEKGHFLYKRPMDSIVWSNKREIGKQQIFYVRHPEPYTFHHYFKSRGLKTVHFYAGFPRHSFDTIRSFINMGFADKEPIDYKGMQIKPVHFLTEMLKKIQIPKNYREKENLWVDIYGTRHRKKHKISMQCIVPTLPGWEDAGCNIDTGMTASIIAEMILKNVISTPGSFAPEGVVPPAPFFKELAKRKMIVHENGKRIN